MNWRAVVFFICLAIVLPSNARSEDRPTVAELVKRLDSSDRQERRDAVHELTEYGPEAEAAIDALVEALKDRDIQIWHDATQALAHLGPKAAPALDALLLGMDSGDEQRRFRTAYALGSIGPAALPAMRERLSATSGNTREVAVRAIGQMGADAEAATHELIERLDDKGEHIQACAVDSLARIGPSTVGHLIDALANDNTNIRSGAAKALAAIGTSANESTQRLIDLSSTDSENTVRAAAIAALGRVAPEGTEIIEPLVQALHDESNVVKRAAVEAWIPVSAKIQTLATERLTELLPSANSKQRVGILLILNRFGPRAASAVNVLIDELTRDANSAELTTTIGQIGQAALEPTYAALRKERITPAQVARIIQGMPSTLRREIAKKTDDESPIVRELAASTIGDLIPFPSDGTSLLTKSLHDDVESVRLAAAKSVRRISKKASPVCDELQNSIAQEKSNNVRATMIHALAAASTKEDSLINCLNENLDHDSTLVQIAALTELSVLDKLPKTIYEKLRERIGSPDAKIRGLASKSLGLIESNGEQTAELLAKLLDDEDLTVREQAIRAIAKLGDDAVSSLPQIQSQLDSDSSKIQVATIESLAELGKRANDALPKIEELSKHERSDIRDSALKSLRRIARKREAIVPTLITGLQDEDKEVRRTAARELGELEELASPAVPALLQMLRNDDDSDEARGALREIGTAGAEAVPTFLEILQDEGSGRRSRYYSLYLLRKMGKKAESALPVLKQLREKEDGRTRESYDRAVDAIEEDLEED